MGISIKTSGKLDLTIPVKCPACGRRIEVKARTASRGSKVRCTCGKGAVEFGDGGAAKVQRALDRLFKNLGRLGK